MNKLILLILIFHLIVIEIMSQVNFTNVSEPFIIDTKAPQLNLLYPNFGTFFINDSIPVFWNASDESFSNNPISIGLSVTQQETYTILLENIINNNLAFTPSGTELTDFGKIKIIAIDTFGLISEDISDSFFNLIVGYSKLEFNPSKVDFGPIALNASTDTTMSVWLKNVGNKELIINNLNGLEEPFEFTFTTPVSIWPDDSTELEVSLNSDYLIGNYTDTIVLDTTSKGNNILPISAILYSSLPQVDLGDDITKCKTSTVPIFSNVTGGVPPYNYLWNTGDTLASISTSTNIDSMFVVTATDSLGVMDSDTLWVLIQQVDQSQEICIVTVDSLSQKNIIVWEKNGGLGTDYYKIYKLGQPSAIDSVHYDSLSTYIDLTSDPAAIADEYWITAVDSCGNESDTSLHHKTILLQANLGVTGSVNLNWNDYIGFGYTHFHIYRGTSYFSLNLIYSVPYGTNAYNDNSPPPLETTYRIVVEKADTCYPSVGKAASGPFKQSLSNIGDGGDIFQFDLTVFLEGSFNNGSMQPYLNQLEYLPRYQPFDTSPWFYEGNEHVDSIPNSDIVDWVLFELRKASQGPPSAIPDSMLFRKPGFLLTNGQVVGMDGSNILDINAIIPTQNSFLYGIIWHRNHLGIMSNSPLYISGDKYEYNFSQSLFSVFGYGDAHKFLGNGIYGMISGDANSDGEIDNIDKESFWPFEAGTSGYKTGDFNMDGTADNKDKNDYWLPNTGSGTWVPE